MNKKIIYILGIVIIAILVYVFYIQPQISSESDRNVIDEVVENADYEISFDYLSGEGGYELIQSATSDDFLQSYVLIEKTALEILTLDPETEAPPTMSIFIFDFPEAQDVDGERPGRITRLQNWAQDNAGLTLFDRIYGAPEIVEVDGVRALEYTTDGRYQQSIYLVGYQGFIYMFVGQYDRPTDIIKKDFEALIENVRFE